MEQDVHSSISGGAEGAFSTPKQSLRKSRTGLLVTVLLLLLLATSYLLRSDPLAVARLQALIHPMPKVTQPVDYRALTKNDPPLSLILPNIGAGSDIRKIAGEPTVGYLLVWVGDCAGCISANLSA